MEGWTLEGFVFAGSFLAWFLVPGVAAFLRLYILRAGRYWGVVPPPPPALTPEQLRLLRQLRAEKAGERLEIGYGSEEEIVESMRRSG